MWWIIGGAVYLLLLTLGLLFLYGASRLGDRLPPDLDLIEARLGEPDARESPRQLPLPFRPHPQPTLSYTRLGFVAAAIHKISGIFAQLPGG
jgi:hypothetical protein